ncbi:molecular chaperone [Paraburkholderia guartelaensis]|uniref:Molecular chaperone n=1 Tax=Paraburkholderia guartelaensis TaxID=2546446 RepID=A0A4R5L1R9_9BURK|nr:molecular chaperone [Paraburkholderia guartelaensis]TDG02260.1 molecular chaperone [Paraburkholderia guartelaensis]
MTAFRFAPCCIVVALLPFTVLSPVAARAATLQISPVMLELQADGNAAALTLRNPGGRPLYGQVRVFRWDQVDGEDTLTPTRDLIASPPLIQVPPQTDQLVRLVRADAAPVAAEQSYRLLIDELPSPGDAPAGGVTIRLRYSVPVFVEPAAATGQPRLAWHLVRAPNGWALRVGNTGSRRAQIGAVELVNAAGKVYVISKGLLGYALAGRSGQWGVPLPADANLGGPLRIRAAVNSLPVDAVITAEQPG